MRALVDGTGRWGDLRLRVVSAAVLAPVALFCIWVGGGPWIALVVVAGLALGMEWVEIIGLRAHGWPGMLLPLAGALAGFVAGTGEAALALALVGVLALVAWWMARRTDAGRSALEPRGLGREATGRWAAGGVVYIGVAVVALCWLRLGGVGLSGLGRGYVLFLMVTVWASDIGAYAVGRMVGGAKLAPSISPGKTRSGAVGGLAAAALVWVLVVVAVGAPGIVAVVGAAVVLAAASQVGDLFESWVKRRFGVKDSGWLIPGHGGVLDRLDGVLAAAPVGALLVNLPGLQGAIGL